MCSKLFNFLYFLLLQTKCLEATETNRYTSVQQPPTYQVQKTPNSYRNQYSDTFPKSCKEIQKRGNSVSDFYIIQPKFSPRTVLVFCDMNTTGGGWTYILNRFDGSQNFHLGWDDYKEGFGNMAGEFWLGLENVHLLTKSEVNELLIELVDWNENKVYAHYYSFSIGSETEGYPLKLLQGYSGDAGDGFSYQAGAKFTTKDKDQDLSNDNCAVSYNGAWWYKSCMKVHLTGNYLGKTVSARNMSKGMYYRTPRGIRYSLKEARMMVRSRRHTNSSLLSDEGKLKHV